ncbi:hypothetical protein SAMN05444354_12861 [Stigmatella aurantiaca]|uniref:Lipoprotein n=1 Tax=Stigmatella aurantiaca TaxID=41 RepID=A0A1H8D5E9_STIAU|nr:hypothetical protein [Stigmatella aurantiaca]SEN01687.1 hypothetical protein SAMN05444354_12861 [Stigmatella aurantiaca]
MRLSIVGLLTGIVLSACTTATSAGRSPRTYAWSTDSPSNACRVNPANCAAMGMTRRDAAETGLSIAAALKTLNPEETLELHQLLHECAKWADDEVNQRRLAGQRPTHQQCQELIQDAHGKQAARAVVFGIEKHEAALQCAQEKLGKFRPGGFSLQQRYGYDRESKRIWLISEAQAQKLIRQNQGKALRGTLVPDVVIHTGNALQILAVYDFKFPCPGSNTARWNVYPQGHAYEYSDQGNIYRHAFGVTPLRASPVWGIQ